MIRTVLIPTDFSSNALHALKYAQELYKCSRTRIYLLHAYADEVYGPFQKKEDTEAFENRLKEVRRASEKQLREIEDSVRGEPPNPMHTIQSVASFDSLVDAVNDFVNQYDADIVIMGTRGRTDDSKITFGSHTVQVFKYVSCPVLAIPEAYDYAQPKTIVFPTDYALPYKRRELKLLNDIGRQFKSKLYFLYISDFEQLSHRQEDNKQFLQTSLPDCYLHFETTPVQNRAQAILESITERKAEMLVMVNSRHSFVEDMLYRSTVDELGLSIRIPFLVMQNLPR